jgi:hypothetical protein
VARAVAAKHRRRLLERPHPGSGTALASAEALEEFIGAGGYGDGSGSGNGYGNAYGDGYGSGEGNGYDNGYGYGDGNGYGGGYGYGGGGFGYGNAYGYGRGGGSGYGYEDDSGGSGGSGSCVWGSGGYAGIGVASIQGMPVRVVDGIPTAFERVRGNAARGFMVRTDLTLEPCYVVKSGALFAHGKTLREARAALETNAVAALDMAERVARFAACHDAEGSYPVRSLHEWHGILTGSCEQGRDEFARSHGIGMEGSMSLKEFFGLTKDAFGGRAIRMAAEACGVAPDEPEGD